MRRILFMALATLFIALPFAAVSDVRSQEPTPETGVQGTVPRFGERPFIDIYKVTDSAIEQGHIRIKLSASHSRLAESVTGRDGLVSSFGIAELDALNRQHGVTRIESLFQSASSNGRNAWRHREWGFHLWFEVYFESRADIRDIVMSYRGLRGSVQWAEPEYKKQLYGMDGGQASLERWTPNDPRFGEQWHYHNTGQTSGTADADIDLPEAWDIEKGHPDVIVDVQDGGYQANHPDLDLNLWTNTGEIAGNGIDDDGNGYIDDTHGYNFVNNSSTLVAHDHGTHVSGTIAAENNNSLGVCGIAGGSGTTRGVSLMSTQVFTSNSSGGFENAPIYGADNGAAISQNSWGYTNMGVYDQAVLDAIDYFNANGGGTVMQGGITIYAAGNNNSSGQWYPGCYSGTFAVAATNHADVRSYYSNYDTWVDVSAPGGETNSVSSRGVLSTLTGSSYGFYQGTSMACPHVSGIAALVLSQAHRRGETITNSGLADILRNCTDDHYAVNPTYIGKLGTGRVNAHTALLALNDFNPPRNLAAIGGNGYVNLTWQAPAFGTPTGYKIFKDGFMLTTVGGLNYTDNAVVNGTTYSYHLTAVYPDGESDPTPTVSATPNIVTSAVLGSGTSFSGTYEGCPINIWYKSLHGQSVYTAAELNAVGVFGPIGITQVGFYVNGVPNLALPNFIIRMKHTSAANVASWQTADGMATVYSNSSYLPVAGGYDMLTLGTPFTWNGADNIVIDTAFSPVANYSASGTTQYSTVSNGYRYTRNDNSDQTSVFSDGTVTSFRPNVKLTLLPTQQNISMPLSQGWNLVSSWVAPQNPDLLSVFASLISAGYLVKIQNEAGNAFIQDTNGLWVNGIGDFLSSEGYYVRVNAPCTLQITGAAVPLPLSVPLSAGWNIIPYPLSQAQPALPLLQPLIAAGLLVKVQDEAGNAIVQDTQGSWQDGIGAFEPGEGYYIKVSQATDLIFPAPAKAGYDRRQK